MNNDNPQRSICESYSPLPKMSIKDLVCLTALAVVIIAILVVLSRPDNAPQTAWQPEAGETVLVDFGEVVEISAFLFYMDDDGSGPFMIVASKDGWPWRTLYYSQTEYSESGWHRLNFEAYTEARFVEIIPFGADGIRIMEAGFRDERGGILPIYSVSFGAEVLVDEQH